jgi:hypothetical protein
LPWYSLPAGFETKVALPVHCALLGRFGRRVPERRRSATPRTSAIAGDFSDHFSKQFVARHKLTGYAKGIVAEHSPWCTLPHPCAGPPRLRSNE